MNASFTCQRQDVHPPNECNTLIPDNDVHDECAPPEPPTCPTDHLQPASSLRPDRHPADPDAARLTDPFGQFQYPTSPLGTSESGFAAEVAAEEAVAMLDYVEDLYRDWNEGARSGGGAARRIDGQFERIHRELGDLPGVVSDEPRLRTMLTHLTKTLHPGVLNDFFFNASTAVCVKRATVLGRPVPQHNMCLRCPNARRSSVHRPRLTAARDQAQELHTLALRNADVEYQFQQLMGHATDVIQMSRS